MPESELKRGFQSVGELFEMVEGSLRPMMRWLLTQDERIRRDLLEADGSLAVNDIIEEWVRANPARAASICAGVLTLSMVLNDKGDLDGVKFTRRPAPPETPE